MQAIIDMEDLRFLRIAARRWAIEHPDNQNAKRVLDAAEKTHPVQEWILTDDEKRRPKDKE